MRKNIEDKLEVAIKAAVSAGNILVAHASDVLKIRQFKKESFRDVVTGIDHLADKKIVEVLREHNPKINILSEEQGMTESSKKGKNRWVVDSLDGTVNYLHQIPFYAVSVAYLEGEKPVAGVVFLPFSNELYYGAEGIGVFKNNSKIRIIDKKPEEALFTQAFSGKSYTSQEEREKEFQLFQKVNDETMGCLRTGSAAINLAYVAEGRFGGCFGRLNKTWDVMAGLLIAKLSGAKIAYSLGEKDKNFISYVTAAPASWTYLKKKAEEMFQVKLGVFPK